jgi:flagellar biosynthesis/type III secretory pathway protein FliH
MSLHFGRVLKVAQPPASQAAVQAGGQAGAERRGRVMGRTEAEARVQAAQLIAEAQTEAARILLEAKTFAETQRENLTASAREQAEGQLASAWLKQHAREAAFSEREKDDVIRCATILAERVIGDELHIAPTRMLAIAEQVLRETRGAKRALVTAHPEDAPALRALFSGSPVYQLETSTELSRGSLLIKTDLGMVDGNIRLQLDRLAEVIRRSL